MQIKLGLIIMLLACLLPLPYGAFMLVRFIATFIFVWQAYTYANIKNKPLTITFAGLALLFQPFFKVTLGRTMWNMVDIIVSILLLYIIFREHKLKK